MIPISQIDPELSIYKENTVVIWGAGQYGREILKLLQNFQIKVACFCDSNIKLWKQEIDGVPIILPQELMKMQLEHNVQENSGVGQIVVQVAMMPQYEAQARPQVEAMGIETVICYEEAFQMMMYYLQCDRLKENPYLLTLRENAERYNYIQSAKKGYDHFLTSTEKLPIYINMVGKTGDNTILRTLKEKQISALLTHNSQLLNRDIFQTENTGSVKIITAVREPISRDISHVFQVVGLIGSLIFHEEIYASKTNNVQYFFDKTIHTSNIRVCQRTMHSDTTRDLTETDVPLLSRWFALFKENVVDVLKHSFDKEKGYTIIKEGNYDIFVYQLEKLNDLVPELSDWVGVPFDTLENRNITADKWIAKSYKQAQKELKFSQEYFDACYNDPYVKHCYSEADIEKFKDRWRGNIDPNK